MKTRIPVFLFLLLLGAAAQAAEFWQEKDYRRWSERDCRKLLENSPWAKRHTVSRVFIQPLQTGPSDPFADANPTDPTERARESNPRMEYQVQLRSALPVRQALVRLAQINENYDQLPAERQQAFDQDAEKFLAESFSEAVVLHVAYSSNVQFYERELALFWQTQTTDTLKNSVFLIGSQGQKISLLRYVVKEGGGREFQFVFPRQAEGRPLVGPEDKSLKLEFNHPNIRGYGASRVFIEFKVDKMLLGGAVIY